MGSLFHGVLGLPVSAETETILSRALEKSFKLQPFRKKVRIVLKKLSKKKGIYGYDSILPTNFDATVIVRYGSATVEASVKYIPRLRYPLMYVNRVIQKKASSSLRPSRMIRKKVSLRSV